MPNSPPSLRGRIDALLEPAQIMLFAAYRSPRHRCVLRDIQATKATSTFEFLTNSARGLLELLARVLWYYPPVNTAWRCLCESLTVINRYVAPSQKPKKLTGSATLVPPLLSQARGDVLEIGPGSGSTIQYYEPAVGAIDSLYAAEPMVGLHGSLVARASAIGITDAFHILTCSAEKESIIPAIAKAGLIENAIANDGVFDTIVCIRVLCSVSHTQSTLQNLYSLLKPGGQFLFVEHVKNPWTHDQGSIAGRLFQMLYTLFGWSFFVGCDIARPTAEILKTVGWQDGGWSVVDQTTHFGWTAMPYISGRLVKVPNPRTSY